MEVVPFHHSSCSWCFLLSPFWENGRKKEIAISVPILTISRFQRDKGGEVTIESIWHVPFVLCPFSFVLCPWNINDRPLCSCIIVKPVYIPYIFCNKSDFSLTFSVKNLGSLQIILFFLRELQKMLNMA